MFVFLIAVHSLHVFELFYYLYLETYHIYHILRSSLFNQSYSSLMQCVFHNTGGFMQTFMPIPDFS